MAKMEEEAAAAAQKPSQSQWSTIVGGIFFAAVAVFVTFYYGTQSPKSALEVSNPRVVLGQSVFTGKLLSNPDLPVPIEAWLGIPYAQPPVGKLRFAKPKAASQRKSRANATEYGSRCPGKQLLKTNDDIPQESEDCLTLNVFKQKESRSKQPVMVYIHGGAFNRGYSSMHDTPSMVSWSPEPFVAVSFNYRLSALGFLPSRVSAKEDILNLGLHDQVMLLEWVQRNIEAFGGNPDDVTIVGLSAGAHSAGHHIMNVNEGRRLFHKAVIESGGPTSRVVYPYASDLHEAQYRQLLRSAGCLQEGEDQQIQCLRGVSSATIIEAQARVFDMFNPSLRWAWQPSIDGDLISRRPIEAWKSGRWHAIPILTGFNHNEGSYYVPKYLSSNEDFVNFFKVLLPQITDVQVDKLVELYPDPDTDRSSPYTDTRDLEALGISSQFKRVEAAYGHYAYVCPVRQTATRGAAAQSEPIYLYHWALNRTVLGGANHADQKDFETMSAKIRGSFDVHDRISEEFHAYLTSFVLTGDPNKVPGLAPDRPQWEAFDNDANHVMLLGNGNDEAAGGESEGWAAEFVKDDWAVEQCRFWWEISEIPEL